MIVLACVVAVVFNFDFIWDVGMIVNQLKGRYFVNKIFALLEGISQAAWKSFHDFTLLVLIIKLLDLKDNIFCGTNRPMDHIRHMITCFLIRLLIHLFVCLFV